MNLLSERVAHAIKVSGHTPSSVARAIGCTPAATVANDAPTPATHVRCPECRELVIHDARKCKHCGCALIPQ
jgi:hypothetical protein